MSTPVKMRLTRRIARETFPLWQRLGLHVTAVHFYEPIPDTRQLPESTWEPSELVGLDMNEAAQLGLLNEIAELYGQEYRRFPTAQTLDDAVFYLANPSFGSVDAEVLYSMVRRLRPQRVLEVGSGYTTLLIAQALRENLGDGASGCEFTAIDPYPNPTIRARPTGLDRLIRHRVQQVAVEEFTVLGENDVLFIDSSHVLGIGSDVQYLFLEVIPRLAPGVFVHVHDIFLPRDYPRTWVMKERRFWTEQYLLQAFLSFNDAWDVVWAGSYMQERHAADLTDAFPSYQPGVLPGSFWMRRKMSVVDRTREQ